MSVRVRGLALSVVSLEVFVVGAQSIPVLEALADALEDRPAPAAALTEAP